MSEQPADSELPGAEPMVTDDEVHAEASAARDQGAASAGDVEDAAGAPAAPSRSRWSGGESAATLFDSPAAGSGNTSALSHLDPFAPKAVPVAANAETPDDPDELVTGDTQVTTTGARRTRSQHTKGTQSTGGGEIVKLALSVCTFGRAPSRRLELQLRVASARRVTRAPSVRSTVSPRVVIRGRARATFTTEAVGVRMQTAPEPDDDPIAKGVEALNAHPVRWRSAIPSHSRAPRRY
jgi:hypothetical protein